MKKLIPLIALFFTAGVYQFDIPGPVHSSTITRLNNSTSLNANVTGLWGGSPVKMRVDGTLTEAQLVTASNIIVSGNANEQIAKTPKILFLEQMITTLVAQANEEMGTDFGVPFEMGESETILATLFYFTLTNGLPQGKINVLNKVAGQLDPAYEFLIKEYEKQGTLDWSSKTNFGVAHP